MFSFIFTLFIQFHAFFGCKLEVQNFAYSPTVLDEASDIVRAGDFYYVVLDDACGLGKVGVGDSSLSEVLPPRETLPCTNSDHEAIFRVPGDADDINPSFYVCGEDTLECNRLQTNGPRYTETVISLIDGGEGCHNNVKWGKNKGIEGAVGIKGTDGTIYMLALIEGSGTVITYKLDQEQWVSQSCTNVPAKLKDYASMAYYHIGGATVFAIVSQKGRQMWVGRVTGIDVLGRLRAKDSLRFTNGEIYDFPAQYKGIEGVFIESYDRISGDIRGVFASDKQAKAPGYANAVHKFSLDCPPANPPCCKALTAECLSCAAGQSVEQYCSRNPNLVDCPDLSIAGVEPCCKAQTAECLSCLSEETIEEYCSENPVTIGCPSQEGTAAPTESRFQLYHNAFCKGARYLDENISDVDQCQSIVQSDTACSATFSFSITNGDCMCVPMGEKCDKATSQKVSHVYVIPTPEAHPAYELVQEDTYCDRAQTIAHAKTVDECVTHALTDRRCGGIIHFAPNTDREYCVCVPKGKTCRFRPSTVGNNVYEIRVNVPLLSAPRYQDDLGTPSATSEIDGVSSVDMRELLIVAGFAFIAGFASFRYYKTSQKFSGREASRDNFYDGLAGADDVPLDNRA